MNPFDCRIVLRPRSPFESLDLAMCVLREHLGAFVRLSAVVLVPIAVALAGIDRLVDSRLGLLAALLLVAPALQVPFTILAARRLFDPTVGVGEVMGALAASWRAFALSAFAVGVSLVAATFSLGVLWLPAHVALLWVVEAAALERLTLRRAVGRSVALTNSGMGRSLVGGVVGAALLLWVVAGAELVGQGLVDFVFQLGKPFGSALDGVVTPYVLGGVLIAQPLIALYRLILYVDVRTAVEGWDLQVAMMAAAETA